MSNLTENIAFVENWAKYTSMKLTAMRKRLDIGKSSDLAQSFGYSVSTSGSMIHVEFHFLARGRFVDMGAGRKAESSGRYASEANAPKGRKPKKWYSKPFYGRLNALNEALSTSVAEEVINSNNTVFKSRANGSYTLTIMP